MTFYKELTNINQEETQDKTFPDGRVEDFYRNGKVFVTGATGFLGKLLLNTLLLQFPAIDTVYILVRERKGVKPTERVDKLFQCVIYEKLSREAPNFRSKIKVVQGDIEAPNLGITSEDYDLLTANVNIIFHIAATLRFREDLGTAIRTNVCATQAALHLAKRCIHLKLFTYVSTAYSNAFRKKVDEKIYQPKTHYSHLITLGQLEDSDKDPEYISARKRLAEESVNTYTLTKAAAEQLIQEEGGGLPVAIFRPGVVISTSKEPIVGWIDNLYGPTGIMSGLVAGIIRIIQCNPDAKADIVPADLTVNALVCSAWHSAKCYQHHKTTSLPIYNFAGSKDNPITWGKFCEIIFNTIPTIPFSRTMWKCQYLVADSKLKYTIYSLFSHYLMGYIIDLFSPLSRTKLRLVPMYHKIDKIVDVLEPFSNNEWDFLNDNTNLVWKSLSPEDKAKFPFDMKDLDWNVYLHSYVEGILLYQLQDKLDPQTRKLASGRYKRLCFVHHCITSMLCVLVVFLSVWIFGRAMRLY